MTSRPIHLIMPMSGQGERYRAAGHTQPKPLIDVNGTPMVERVLSHFPTQWPAHFILADNHRDTALPSLLKCQRPQGTQQFIAPHKLGPGHAVSLALEQGAIPDDAPVFVSYCDYGMVWDVGAFERFVRASRCDACVVAYRGFHAHYLSPTKYAYARLQGERVVEVREKGNFTDDRENEYASAGGYYFRSAAVLRRALEAQVERKLLIKGEYYNSLTVEALLQADPAAHVRVFEIDGFFQWGTPEDLQDFCAWEKAFAIRNRDVGRRGKVAQVLMPMAGLGSRFVDLTATPKPLIPIFELPMYQAALASLPQADHTVVVALDTMAAQIAAAPQPTPVQVVGLPATPPGQALSTAAGLDALRLDQEVLVSACDHAIVLETSRWQLFHAQPDCDAAIFTLRGCGATDRRPTAYSYVVPQTHGPPSDFPPVARVSVKVPVSQTPSADAVLVGSFWFRDAHLLRDSIAWLEQADIRVNGELYLDSVFEGMQARGLCVRMIALDGFICWGEPESLAQAMYWQEMLGGRLPHRRPRLASGLALGQP